MPQAARARSEAERATPDSCRVLAENAGCARSRWAVRRRRQHPFRKGAVQAPARIPRTSARCASPAKASAQPPIPATAWQRMRVARVPEGRGGATFEAGWRKPQFRGLSFIPDATGCSSAQRRRARNPRFLPRAGRKCGLRAFPIGGEAPPPARVPQRRRSGPRPENPVARQARLPREGERATPDFCQRLAENAGCARYQRLGNPTS